MAMQPPVHGNRHMVSSGHLLATQAGYEILEAGGNAIDAGVAAGIALGVVHSDMVQFSGVAPIMIYLSERDEVITISGLGGWPKAASIERFIDEFDGHVPEGVLRTVVPAAPDAWITALERYGTMTFGEVAEAAIRFACDGFPMHHVMRDYIIAHANDYRRWPSNAAIYLPNDQIPDEGERFVQRDLGASLQFLADEERARGGSRAEGLGAAHDAFYRGDLAVAMVEYHQANGGWLARDDLSAFRSEVGSPVQVTIGDVTLFTCDAWCQGPVLAQMATLVEPDRLAAMSHNEADYVHYVLEAMKLCFADRECLYGDPNVVNVPLEHLLSRDYARRRRADIQMSRAAPDLPAPGIWGEVAHPSPARAVGIPPPAADTSYACAVDAAGNLFSATPSDVSWESPIIPGTGFAPSARGSQSWAVLGHPSAVAPGKRPRLTPNPAIAMRRGHWRMPFGTPGGDTQTQAMLQVLLNTTVFEMALQDAIEAPRFISHSFPNSFEPHESYPGRVSCEGRIDPAVVSELARRGHEVTTLADMTYATAGVCGIRHHFDRGLLEGGADPRRMSRALGR
ncbi:MAG: gamma-glutamyltransferase [Pseudomonadota bacterium]